MATAFDVEGHLEWIVSKDQENDFSISPKVPSLLAELADRIFRHYSIVNLFWRLLLNDSQLTLYWCMVTLFSMHPTQKIGRTCLLGKNYQVLTDCSSSFIPTFERK